MARVFTEKQMKEMKRVFDRTLSCALTAKVCGCNPVTVARYRDRGGWIELKKPLGMKSANVPSTLTADIAVRLAVGWRENISDDALCDIIGITEGQLRWWLQNNTSVTIVKTVKQIGADGEPLKDSEGMDLIERRAEAIGIHDLRVRQKQSLEFDYLTKHARVIDAAERSGDYRTAVNAMQWRLQVANARKYGGQSGQVNVNLNSQTNIVHVDDLNLPLDTRRQILSKIREVKQIPADTQETKSL
jgi:hypothetical protein